MLRRDALNQLERMLLNRRAELHKRLGMELEDLHLNEANGTGDSADAAFDSGSEELASQLAEMESNELAQIENALRQLKQGSYGRCEGCGCKIPLLRLKALPYSTMCIQCQREMETNADWEPSRSDHAWSNLNDHDDMDEKDVDLADLETDLTK
ncbi:TraR/DksA family transcriptional regulator [Tuwongella immobilis]|uniref:Zinc finger DksA/TraR C4-type domain-containing protein n=1 Tax=Tuwongella immobilis TaxID=692036 RepID=A0A6C2YWL1_9BACT|nr:TraR/DksA C4-type zinc finger protein [Tuwongella immobilis]VIP05225.1 suppressor protein : Probable DnaK suppressor protein OS=Blastopirellula marina DSM 3645 GN=DSM3645_20662 PE=4 SV=1: zf-dskA_traR [Tuwongella immobilis]VTS07806.1 suppressor protein : Probable DnaK suppressor protein OS=Blastopirellula marina DSM 3645 GN=DSM3645_20662 PE=4 SV=1: zf-dskA_traR [Tuwongella immobilis]